GMERLVPWGGGLRARGRGRVLPWRGGRVARRLRRVVPRGSRIRALRLRRVGERRRRALVRRARNLRGPPLLAVARLSRPSGPPVTGGRPGYRRSLRRGVSRPRRWI